MYTRGISEREEPEMQDGREVTQGEIWNAIPKGDKRKITSSAQPANADGSPASKEQVRARQQGS
jgi:uncharacterized protein YaeQ